MIILFTTTPSKMYLSEGLEPYFHALQEEVRRLATALAKSDIRVLVLDDRGRAPYAEIVRQCEENPLVVNLPPYDAISRINDPDIAALGAIWQMLETVEAFCGRRIRCECLAILTNVDRHFWPEGELGTFTMRMGQDQAVVERLASLGECLAGYDGHLILVAALSQSPQRLLGMVDEYGWSWVRLKDDRLELRYGALPEFLRRIVEQPPTVDTQGEEWTLAMTIKELAACFGVSRNTMAKRLKTQEVRNRKLGGRYQIPAKDLPK